ncbi:MAG: YfhO family protein [Clostridia bacterium]
MNLRAAQFYNYIFFPINRRVFQRIEAGKEASVVYTIQITSESPLYAYFPAPNLQGAEIFIGDRSLGAYFDVFRYDIVLLGKFPAGSTVSFTIKLLDDILQVDDALFYYENHTALQQNYEILSEGTGQFLKKSSSHLIATVDITKEDAYMLFTIPYEDGWRITIDGNEAEKQKVFDALIAVEISKGTHQIALKYTPKGFYAGAIISGAALTIIGTVVIAQKIKKRTKKKT